MWWNSNSTLTGLDARSECLNLIIPHSLPSFPQAPFCLGIHAHKSYVLAGHALPPSAGSDLSLHSWPHTNACAHLDGCWVRSRVAGHTSCHNGSGVQKSGRIKRTQAQDCSLEIEASECLNITSVAEETGLEREKQFLNYMVSVPGERRSFRVGWGSASIYT